MTVDDLGGQPPLPLITPTRFVHVAGHDLEYVLIGAHQLDRPALVFLHEGLGCLSMWRDFPARVAAATGCRTLIYSRYGYGRSDVLKSPRTPRYLHDEALSALPELLQKLRILRPVLIGHSDGASMALILAGDGRSEVAGVVAMAPHVFVEDISLEGIRSALETWRSTDLPRRLARYHRDPEATFHGWADIWLSREFGPWNIEEYLASIRCPVLAIQGEDDEYGSMAQLDAIARRARDVELLKLADCRHSPHKDQPQAVFDAIVGFVGAIP
jgi:pimeloyl-ACP methyl ester carboxylesterase